MAKTELPAWSKGVIGVLIAGGSAFALFKIYQYFGKLKEQAGQKAEIDTTTQALKDLKTAGKGGSLTKVQVDQLANKLQTAFAGYGTDFKAIESVFLQIKNEFDILSIRQAYGIRKISSGRLNLASDFEGTLDQTLIEELSQKDIQALNMILARKGIKNRI
tara:strand:- start:336 stop:818 length:483 start_codon:yes stop_codon:yes gene_type:complete